MNTLFLVLIILLSIVIITNLFLIYKFSKRDKTTVTVNNDENFQKITLELNKLENFINVYNTAMAELNKDNNKAVVGSLKNIGDNQFERLENLNKTLEILTHNIDNKFEKNTSVLENGLKTLKDNNEQKLEQMRMTVDEKLNETLEKRLTESYSIISQRLESVSKGLGEMKSLAGSVGDLKKVLSNVKTRGTFGEVQLGTLLEQVLAPSQFEPNVLIKDEKRVDFVIKLPGKDDRDLLLPIDAKFPIEDYIRIIDAENADKMEEVLTLSKALEKRIKDEAKKINEKYIQVPITTDFAIMYLPLEGLYCEAIKKPGLIEQLQRDYHIIVCGPTTLAALLNSLQMGFQTLAIEKRSSEIWSLLSTFKKEFVTFVDLLTKTQKKIDEASGTIGEATKKTQKIQKQLSKVVLLSDNEQELNLISIDDNDKD